MAEAGSIKIPTLYVKRGGIGGCLVCWDAGCRHCPDTEELCRVERCEHGNIDPHENPISEWIPVEYAPNGEVSLYRNRRCDGSPTLAVFDE